MSEPRSLSAALLRTMTIAAKKEMTKQLVEARRSEFSRDANPYPTPPFPPAPRRASKKAKISASAAPPGRSRAADISSILKNMRDELLAHLEDVNSRQADLAAMHADLTAHHAAVESLFQAKAAELLNGDDELKNPDDELNAALRTFDVKHDALKAGIDELEVKTGALKAKQAHFDQRLNRLRI